MTKYYNSFIENTERRLQMLKIVSYYKQIMNEIQRIKIYEIIINKFFTNIINFNE